MKSKGAQTVSFNGWAKPFSLLLTIFTCSFYGTWLSCAAATTATDRSRVAYATVSPPIDFNRLKFSTGVLDIVRMVKANVNPELIKTFINHSGISYNPSAQEVIALKKLGVSNDIIVTMLNHRPRASETAQSSARQILRGPEPQEMLAMPAPPPSGGSPVYRYPGHTFPVLGSVTSFNNSFPTFVGGQPVYSGYYFQSYPVIW